MYGKMNISVKQMTKRQLEIYNFIKNFIKVNGVSPSYNEIVTGCGIKSKSHAYTIVDALIQKDYLKKIGNISSARRIIIHRDYQKGGRKVWKGSQV
jgi:SOS-response transcriptional repressor LexA